MFFFNNDYTKDMNIAVLASGNGTNFEAVAKAIKRNYLKATIKCLITDKQTAFVRKRAQKFEIPDIFIDPRAYTNREAFDREIIKILKRYRINLVVLAGYMRIVGPGLIEKFKHRILNINPAILPSFKGMHGIEDAFNYGVKVTGVTVHFVDEQMDHGPIILQEAVKINNNESLKSLETKIHKIEHKIYPEAVRLFVEGRLKVEGRQVRIA